MPHVITQPCCSDASCVYACPVNCIHPSPDEPDFLTAEMLHIDPEACVDCGACVTACPVDAIVPESQLSEAEQVFVEINADFYRPQRSRPSLAPVIPAPEVTRGGEPLRVAIVGSGPAAMYAADELLTQYGVRVNVFDRQPVPYGLVRTGVAPDHQRTKRVGALFDTVSAQPGFEFYLGVEVGTDITHAELLAHHHAVLYAVGAATDRPLEIPGADLPGAGSATEFVAWYNGDPDRAGAGYDLSHERVVIVGNGNVALDAARILTMDPELLAGTDISSDALAVLRESKVREVVLLARRGAGQSAFTVPEFAGLLETPGVDVRIEGGDYVLDSLTAERRAEGRLMHATKHKLALLDQVADKAPTGGRTITLRYLESPTEILGDDRVTGVATRANEYDPDADRADAIRATDRTDEIEAGLVLSAIGYRGRPVTDLPFDFGRDIVPNDRGRVHTADGGDPVTGTYVTGWIKRGPSGFIGTNKSCARESVGLLVDDFNDRVLPDPAGDQRALDTLVRSRRPDVVDRAGWQAIDRIERERGAAAGRVREKIVEPAALHALAAEAKAQAREQRPRRRLLGGRRW